MLAVEKHGPWPRPQPRNEASNVFSGPLSSSYYSLRVGDVPDLMLTPTFRIAVHGHLHPRKLEQGSWICMCRGCWNPLSNELHSRKRNSQFTLSHTSKSEFSETHYRQPHNRKTTSRTILVMQRFPLITQQRCEIATNTPNCSQKLQPTSVTT